MKQFAKPLSLTLGLVALAAISVLLNTGSVDAQTSHSNAAPAPGAPALTVPVNVTNTPLPVQGSVNASVTGTVSVKTTPTTPVYVDADRSARNGFNASCFTPPIDSVSGQASCNLLSIPAGQQVVIETVSCQAEVPAGQGPGDVQLIIPNTPFGGGPVTNVSHLLALTKQAGNSTLDIWRMTTPLRAYAGAPSAGSVNVGLFFRGDPASTAPQGIICSISGYLVGQ